MNTNLFSRQQSIPLHSILVASLKFRKSQGFTVVEAFASLMVIMISLAIALQMFASMVYIRVRAKQFDDAYSWIQEDFETVRSKATEFEQGAVPYSSYCSAPANSNLAATFITSTPAGLGGSSVTVGTKSFNGKDYELVRSADYASTIAPTQLVSLQYVLVAVESGNPVFNIDAEVTLYAAFKCPR